MYVAGYKYYNTFIRKLYQIFTRISFILFDISYYKAHMTRVKTKFNLCQMSYFVQIEQTPFLFLFPDLIILSWLIICKIYLWSFVRFVIKVVTAMQENLLLTIIRKISLTILDYLCARTLVYWTLHE